MLPNGIDVEFQSINHHNIELLIADQSINLFKSFTNLFETSVHDTSMSNGNFVRGRLNHFLVHLELLMTNFVHVLLSSYVDQMTDGIVHAKET